MTADELEKLLNEKIEPALDPDKVCGLLICVCKEGEAGLLARRMGPNALVALATQLLKAAEENAR